MQQIPPELRQNFKASFNALKALGAQQFNKVQKTLQEIGKAYQEEKRRDYAKEKRALRLAKLKKEAAKYLSTHPGMPLPCALAMEIKDILRHAGPEDAESGASVRQYLKKVAPEEWGYTFTLEGRAFSLGQVFTLSEMKEHALKLKAMQFKPCACAENESRYRYPLLHPLTLCALHYTLIQALWQSLPLNPGGRQRCFLPALSFLAECSSSLPASEGNHDYAPMGLFYHSLRTLQMLIKVVYEKKLVPPSDASVSEAFWSALILLAFTHDLAKGETDFMILDAKERELTHYGAYLPLTLAAVRGGNTSLTLYWIPTRGEEHKEAMLAYRKSLFERLYTDLVPKFRELLSLDLLLYCTTAAEARSVARGRAGKGGAKQDWARRDRLSIALLSSLFEADQRAVRLSRREHGLGLGDRSLACLYVSRALHARYILPCHPEIRNVPGLPFARQENLLPTAAARLRKKGFVKRGKRRQVSARLQNERRSSERREREAKDASCLTGGPVTGLRPGALLEHSLPYLKVALPHASENVGGLFVFFGSAFYEELYRIRDLICALDPEKSHENSPELWRRLGMAVQVGPRHIMGWFAVEEGRHTLAYVYGMILRLESALFKALPGESYNLHYVGVELPGSVRLLMREYGPMSRVAEIYPYIVSLRDLPPPAERSLKADLLLEPALNAVSDYALNALSSKAFPPSLESIPRHGPKALWEYSAPSCAPVVEALLNSELSCLEGQGFSANHPEATVSNNAGTEVEVDAACKSTVAPSSLKRVAPGSDEDPAPLPVEPVRQDDGGTPSSEESAVAAACSEKPEAKIKSGYARGSRKGRAGASSCAKRKTSAAAKKAPALKTPASKLSADAEVPHVVISLSEGESPVEPASFAVPCPETLKSPALPEAMYLTSGGYLSLKSCAIDDLLADFKEELNETRSQYTKRRLELNRRMRSAKKGDAEAEKQREALSEAHLQEDPEREESYCDPCEEEL